MNIPDLIKKILETNSTARYLQYIQRYIKWIALGVGVLFVLLITLLILVIFAVFQLLVRPAASQTPALIEQGQTLVEQGQTVVEQQSQNGGWSMLFAEQIQQAQGILQQAGTIQQAVEDPTVLIQQQFAPEVEAAAEVE